MAVLTAPDRIKKPTTTTKALSSSLSRDGTEHICIARPPIKLSEYSFMRTSSGISSTARKLMLPVSTGCRRRR